MTAVPSCFMYYPEMLSANLSFMKKIKKKSLQASYIYFPRKIFCISYMNVITVVAAVPGVQKPTLNPVCKTAH